MGEVPAKGNLIPCIPVRYIVSILGSVAMAIIYGLKVNLSVAIVAMVNETAIKQMSLSSGHAEESSHSVHHDPEECLAPNTSDSADAIGTTDGPFVWSSKEQGLILSCYFMGYLASQIPGAILATRSSAKWVMFFSVASNAICTLLTPIAAEIGIWALVVLRIIEGIGGGVSFPAEHTLISKWAPPNERSTISSIIYAGTALGTVIFMFTAGILSNLYGWESIFYVQGGLSCIWFVFWIFLVSDSPSEHKYIDKTERDLIVSSLGGGGGHGHEKPKKIPWGEFVKSTPVWAITVAHVCNNWGFYMLLIELPIYMKGIFKVTIKENATYTSIPFFTFWIFSIIISKSLDSARSRGKITTTIARKIATLFCSVTPMICLIALCYIGCNKMAAVVIAGAAVTSKGAMFSGFLSNHIDLSPNFAGILVAFTNTFGTMPGIIVPFFVGGLIHDDPSIRSWRIVFTVTIVLYVIEIIFYNLLASGEEQPFNNIGRKTQTNSELKPLNSQEHSRKIDSKA